MLEFFVVYFRRINGISSINDVGGRALIVINGIKGIMTLVPLMMLGGDLPLSHLFYVSFSIIA